MKTRPPETATKPAVVVNIPSLIRTLLPLFVTAVILDSSRFARAQSQSSPSGAPPSALAATLTLRCEDVPAHLLLRRGTQLVVEGTLPPGGSGRVILRRGRENFSESPPTENWKVYWNSRGELSSTFSLSVVHVMPGKPEVLLARVFVQMYDESPCRLVAPRAGDSLAGDRADVRISRTDSEVQPERYEVLIDDKPTSRSLVNASTGLGKVDLAGIPPGPHRLRVRAYLPANSGVIDTQEITVQTAARVILAPIGSGTVDLRQSDVAPPPPIVLDVKPVGEALAGTTRFLLDGQEVGRSTIGSAVNFNAGTLQAGMHLIRAAVATADGREFVTPDVSVTVLRDPQREFAVWRARVEKIGTTAPAADTGYNAMVGRLRGGQRLFQQLVDYAEQREGECLRRPSLLRALTPPVGLSDAQQKDLVEAQGLYARGWEQMAAAWHREAVLWRALAPLANDLDMVNARLAARNAGGSFFYGEVAVARAAASGAESKVTTVSDQFGAATQTAR